MHKNKIKEFAISARNQLRENIINKLFELGITEKEIKKPLDSSTKDIEYFDIGLTEPISVTGDNIRKRNEIINILENYSKDSSLKEAFNKLVEEVAYTWFNRLIAIRFMEVNDYLPSRIRVLSSEEGSKDPDILRFPFNADIEYSAIEVEQIRELQDKGDFEELYKLLLLKQSRELGDILPFLFNSNSNYLELLFPLSYSDSESVLNDLINSIPEEDFDVNLGGQIELIGWLYQYYNSDKREQTYASFKKGKKVTAENLPSATQIFTPDWIVKYMVENTVGKLWIEHLRAQSPSIDEKEIAQRFKWKYYVPEAPQDEETLVDLKKSRQKYLNLSVEDLTILDPSQGSGHILLYAFEVLLQIYESEGYAKREAAILILEKNLYGLDIDDRASQLAYFSLLMKARQYNRRLFSRLKQVNTYSIPDKLNIYDLTFLESKLDDKDSNLIKAILEKFEDSKLLGSLLEFDEFNIDDLEVLKKKLSSDDQLVFKTNLKKLKDYIDVIRILKKEYWIVVTNPPYMGNRYLNSILTNFLRKNYRNYKTDLFSAFMVRCFKVVKKDGFLGFLSPYVWMFIHSYEALRKYFLEGKTIESLIQFEYSALKEATVPICTFILRNNYINKRGTYFRLTDFTGGMEVQEQRVLDALNNQKSSYLYYQNSNKFNQIPGFPIAYWISDALFDSFKNGKSLDNYGAPKHGMHTGKNELFLRLWTEVNKNKINFNAKNSESFLESKSKWTPYNKGGKFRRWYGNNDYLIEWSNNGFNIRNFKNDQGKQRSSTSGEDFFFKESVTWSAITSSTPSFRFKQNGFIFDVKGSSIFASPENLYWLLSLTNTKLVEIILDLLNPTISIQSGDIAKIPVIIDENYRERVEELAKENIELSKIDWDSFEFSWDFKKHPLIRGTKTIKEAFELWEKETEDRFKKLKANEEELNEIFIKIYGLEDELTPEVEDKYVSVRKADREREIKSLISYAVGVLFGRYSLDKEGLVLAGGDMDYSNYQTIIPDEDNIIPILDEEYFEDDIVGLFLNFIKTVYGEEKFEENLTYIADSLGGRNKTSREIIRDYFKKDFFKDHLKIYQKRPIYWLYSSGRQGGAKALIYMHRYNKETTAKLKADYLTRLLRTYINEIDRLEKINAISTNKREVAQNKKQITKLQKQLKEAQEFNDKISHLADLSIDIDLDDGVKVNYEKVQTDENGKNLKVLQLIN